MVASGAVSHEARVVKIILIEAVLTFPEAAMLLRSITSPAFPFGIETQCGSREQAVRSRSVSVSILTAFIALL